ncbi:tRNA glutamyl-Q(34) synthetase GluQRS [Devosia algicola]|uniref:tRNA glutamyl-Q(34) synthetase GluQRS n=1 Tax=Devosia algicola TaxID=3026418 RepID=A0ABY7YJS6_9HYPH|nr:tRNA glutamyl-Q(34) synthetase GluQRS [Devosia algicola]WDR01442.1 tRNA glutamyl-Q(34) synthetase GluQRS [Devosia algicola]
MSANLPRLRFAPSPNGLLHLGHAYSALFTWQAAERLGASTLLRIEDIDIERCKPEYDAAILRDLAWLGLEWPEPVWRQSLRFEHYRAAAAELNAHQLLYPCFCSRRIIAAHARGTDPDGAPLYSGTCRHLSPRECADRLERGEPVQYRLDMERALALTGPLTFTLVGPSVLDRPQIRYAQPQRWGDVVLQRKETPTSYHLSVVVDDAAQAITHVTRGRDMEAATDIHVLLQFLLGLPSPIYNFHNLIRDQSGAKLAKSKGSPSLASLRESGWTPEKVRAQLGLA